MDKAILDKLIQCYETDMDELYGGEHDEIFKCAQNLSGRVVPCGSS